MLCSVTLFVGVSFGRYFCDCTCIYMSCCVVCMCEDELTRLYNKYVDSGLLDVSNAVSTHFS